jgi:hypothetical protein
MLTLQEGTVTWFRAPQICSQDRGEGKLVRMIPRVKDQPETLQVLHGTPRSRKRVDDGVVC